MSVYPNLSARRIEILLLCSTPCHDLNLYHGHQLRGVPAGAQNLALAAVTAQGLAEVDDFGMVQITALGSRLLDRIFTDPARIRPEPEGYVDPSQVSLEDREALIREATDGWGDMTFAALWEEDPLAEGSWPVVSGRVDQIWREVLAFEEPTRVIDGSRFAG